MSALSGAEMGALSFFNVVVLGCLALLAVRWRASVSASFPDRWRWWLLGAVVVMRVLGLAAAVFDLIDQATLASSIGMAGLVWLVISTPSGRRVTWVQAVEVWLSLLCGALACVHGGRVAWALLAAMALLRLLTKVHRERGDLYLAVLVVLLVDTVLGTYGVPVWLSPTSLWRAVLPGLPLLALTWTIASGLPLRARRWGLLPSLARRICGRMPMSMVLAVASCALLLWQNGSPTAMVVALAAVVLCIVQLVLLKRQERWFERVSNQAGENTTRLRQVRAHLRRVLGEEGHSDSDCTVMMVDVDHFAAFNRRYGRQSGHQVLDRVGTAIQANLMRAGDRAARWRGDCFLVVLPSTSAVDAPVVAQRLLAAVQALGIGHVATPSGVVTVSIGVASRPARFRQRAGRLLRNADVALQRAKSDGRNRWDGDVLPVEPSTSVPLAVGNVARP